MRRLWTIANWFTFTGLPACLAYFTNFRGFASNLDEAATSLAPVLAALVPFVAIMLGAASGVAIVRYVCVVARKGYVALVYGDAQTFQSLGPSLAQCRAALVAFHDTPRFMFHQGEIVERVSRLRVDLFLLCGQLFRLGIWVPNAPSLEDPQERVRLIWYLTTLASLAHRRNLVDAQSIRGLPN